MSNSIAIFATDIIPTYIQNDLKFVNAHDFRPI